jgi:hypothetical protein
MERAALAGGPIRKQNALATPEYTATDAQKLQERRLTARFFLSPEIAATIARLHFGEARA